MRVRLIQSDRDYHDAGCDCGLCNFRGVSIGVSIYDATNDDGTDAALDTMLETDPVDRVYGCSEAAAMEGARSLCAEKGWKVI